MVAQADSVEPSNRKGGREQLSEQDKTYCNLKRCLLAQHLLRFRGWGEGMVQHACFGLALDDILVWSKTFEQELTSLQMVCNTLKVISLKSNPQTSESSQAEVINYECRASQGMVFTDTKQMEAGQSWAALQTTAARAGVGLGMVAPAISGSLFVALLILQNHCMSLVRRDPFQWLA